MAGVRSLVGHRLFRRWSNGLVAIEPGTSLAACRTDLSAASNPSSNASCQTAGLRAMPMTHRHRVDTPIRHELGIISADRHLERLDFGGTSGA